MTVQAKNTNHINNQLQLLTERAPQISPDQIQTFLWSVGTLCLLQILQTASDHPH